MRGASLGFGCTIKGSVLWRVSPHGSSMLSFFGSNLLISQFPTKALDQSCCYNWTILNTRLIPTQILRPAPNGMTSKSCPWISTLRFSPPGKNRVGWNSSGPVHIFGSITSYGPQVKRSVDPLDQTQCKAFLHKYHGEFFKKKTMSSTMEFDKWNFE